MSEQLREQIAEYIYGLEGGVIGYFKHEALCMKESYREKADHILSLSPLKELLALHKKAEELGGEVVVMMGKVPR